MNKIRKNENNFVCKIRLLNDNVLIRNIISNFVNNYWFAPQDCLLRASETLIWAKRYFNPPVLDIGTGDGRNSRFMFAYNQKIDIGIDVDVKAVNEAKKSGVYYKVQVNNAYKMSFKDSSFNTVICHSTLEHIVKDEKAISEISRILNIGGLIYFTVPLPEHVEILRKIMKNDDELHNYNERVVHLRYRNIKEWQKILIKNNFKVLFHRTYFNEEVYKTWYKFYKISTFRIKNRELWSYLKDSFWGKLIPTFIVKALLKNLIIKNIFKAIDFNGGWVFIVAERIK